MAMPAGRRDPATLQTIARSRLQHWLQQSGLSQAAFAARIGKTQTWVSRYFKGEYGADLETLDRMAAVFDETLFAVLDVPRDPVEARIVALMRLFSPAFRVRWLRLLEAARPARGRSTPTRTAG